MPTVILIGFEYTFNILTGAIIDLYNAYKWCLSFGCDIHVLTDITSVKHINNLYDAINLEIVNTDILSFYDNIKSLTIVTNAQVLLTNIIKILEKGVPDNKVIIYYSGHGIKESMVMPDRTLLPFIDFRDNILSTLKYDTEIFWILDCCNPNGLYLPFNLNGNRFILSSSKIKCVSQPILLITSSESHEKSIATKFGSIFSRHLFDILTLLGDTNGPIIWKGDMSIPLHKNRNLRRLIGNISSSIRKLHTGYTQTVSIYSSYLIDPVLWMWIGSTHTYDIASDLTLTTLIIRNSNLEQQYHKNATIVDPVNNNDNDKKTRIENAYDVVCLKW